MRSLFICLLLLAHYVFAIQPHTSHTCDSPIYCEGPILKTVQLAQLFDDSKTFVDMPTSKSEAEVVQAFQNLGGVNATRDQVKQFLEENFLTAGAEVKLLTNISITDLKWIDNITDIDYRGWANVLNQAWANLTFTFDYSLLCDNCTTSSIPVERPFVVPGGRFREFYYWDSFFVIKGLLLSDQIQLARNMIENFFDFIEKFGFVPNGARIYYLNRSQPPFLTHMVEAYFEKTGDKKFMKKALSILDKEYKFWMTNKTVEVPDPKNTRKNYTLNHYFTHNTSPRPESYVEDYNTYVNVSLTEAERSARYADIAAGAESGWDYSSRWIRNKAVSANQTESYEMLRTINTANIVPIDLNSLLYYSETKLAEWHKKYDKNTSKQKYYAKQARNRLKAMEALMWNQDTFSYYDYNLSSNAQNIEFTPANLYPIWVGAFPETLTKNRTAMAKVFDETENALRRFPGILTTSYYNTTLQWDWPNGWPPLTYIAIAGMLRVDEYLHRENYTDDGDFVYKGPRLNTTQGTSITSLATTLAERYTASAYCGWYNTGGSLPGILEKENASLTDNGHMFEKFDVNTIGLSGSQGEYVSQTGFGWTNGIALWVFSLWSNFTAPNCTQTITLNF